MLVSPVPLIPTSYANIDQLTTERDTSRTRIDDCETPREMAEAMGLSGISQLLAAHEVSERQ